MTGARVLPPVEFVDAPSGADLSRRFITALVDAYSCGHCYPDAFRFRFQPAAGQEPTEVSAWKADTFHARSCPGAWLAEQRFADTDETPEATG